MIKSEYQEDQIRETFKNEVIKGMMADLKVKFLTEKKYESGKVSDKFSFVICAHSGYYSPDDAFMMHYRKAPVYCEIF